METELDETEVAEIVTEADLEIGLHSRWRDAKRRVFIITGVHQPQLHNGRVRSTQFDLLEVNQEFSRPVNRPDFESWVREGLMIRVLSDVAV